MKNIIHSQKLEDIKPIIWYSKPVYSKYKQIVNVLKDKISENIEYLLLEPNISEGSLKGDEEATWGSEKYKRLKPLTTYSEKKQDELKLKLKNKINQILLVAKNYENSENSDEIEFSEFLKQIVEVPSLDHVYTDGENIALACWGFKSIEIINKDFKLSKVIEKDNIDNELPLNTSIKNDASPNEHTNKKTKLTKRDNNKQYIMIAFLILLILLILGLLYYFKNDLFENKSINKEVDRQGYRQEVKPINPKKVIIDEKDPMKKKIITNRLTVILDIDNNVTNEMFKKVFNNAYPNSGIKIVYEEPIIGLLEFEILENDRTLWIEKLEKLKEVITAYVENIIESSYIPNDKGFNETKKEWLFEATNTYKGWDKTKGSNNIVVAVIDGAFDLSHPELKSKNIVKPWNAAKGTPELTRSTQKGYLHGTHVATIATGIINNDLGTGGICPECSLMPIQIGQENMEGFSSNTVLRAILYAIKNDADVINLSIGKTYNIDYSRMNNREKKDLKNSFRRKTIKEEIKYERVYKLARDKNIPIVYASGNDNMYSDIDPQKRSANIIVVGAIDNKINKSSFSNYGENVTLTAPGTQIYSAAPNNKYQYLDGTSMASPIVTGIIGLMKSLNPNLPNDRIHEILIETGKSINGINNNTNWMGPLVQVDKALTKSIKSYNCQDEVRRLKKELENCKNGKNKKMVIPDKKSKDFKFAEGLWKSSSSLYEWSNDKEIKTNPIVLYFDIKKTGKGYITLDLIKKSEKCIATIELSFNKEILKINQLENAKCNKSNYAYRPYKFDCVSLSGKAAICEAKGNNRFTFELEQVK